MHTTEDVLEVMATGARNRAVAETKMNERSSRSHSVLTIMVDGVNNVTGIRTHGCLHLIDLAGGLAGCCLWLLQQNHADRFSWAGSSTHSCLCLISPAGGLPSAVCVSCSRAALVDSPGR